MTLRLPLWGGLTTYGAVDDRQLINQLFRTPGVIDFAAGDLKVRQRSAGANMSVDVSAGGGVIEGTEITNQGRYLCTSDATVNLGGITAPGAGTSRIDRIVARVIEADIAGTGSSSWVLERIPGTAAATPTIPGIPASSLPLARFTVTSSTTTITDAMITDDRVPAVYLARGLVVAEFSVPAQTMVNTEITAKNFGPPTVRPGSISSDLFHDPAFPTRMKIPWTGLYSFSWTPQIASAGGFGWSIILRRNAETTDMAIEGPNEAIRSTLVCTGMYMTAGEYLRVSIENNTGANRNLVSTTAGIPRLMYHGAL